MPDGTHLLAFLFAAIVLAILPGPGMLYVLARSLGGGARVGVRSTLGTAIGGLGNVAAASIGLSALLMTSATAFEVVKLAGAAYLMLLGVRTLLGLRGSNGSLVQPGNRAARGALRQGIVTELLNPKTALFFLTFLPQFVQPDRGPVMLQLAVLGAVSVTLNSSMDLLVSVSASPLSALLRRRPRLVRSQKALSGCALIALGGYAAVDGP